MRAETELPELVQVAIEGAAYSGGGPRVDAPATASPRQAASVRNQMRRILEDLPADVTVGELLEALEDWKGE
ncbi:hypothetical protein A7A08_01731 [Methyloligella halotolerans]|uniref:Uncharacterized protein n=1 Tax=Methyloligella halotolerans TaxID=1177755 RepID=A0A1E2RZN4_9HYPH|nr:hypothetical protein [Methyloligella halotolerans]ODA67696.1 hypothetical protein A7A08_01731 [Methyloligella halotolerans]